MADTTLGFPYPAATDPPAGHTQIQALADAVDLQPGVGSFTQAQITAFTAGEKRAGRIVWNSTTGTLQRCDGSAFVDVVLASGAQTLASKTLTTPTIASMVNANHNHSAGAGGGLIPESSVTNLVSDLAAKVASTIVDAKGDLIAGTAADTVSRLAVGTDGQALVADSTAGTGLKWGNVGGLVLVTPSTIANSGGSASTSGGQVTFTGVSSISLNGVFSSTYDTYLVVLRGTISADNPIQFRLRAAGTDNSSANYYFQFLQASAATVAAGRFSMNSSHQLGNFDAAADYAVEMTVSTPAAAAYTIIKSDSSHQAEFTGIEIYRGLHNLATAYDGFTLYPTGGTITGKARVYGYKNT